MILTLSNLVRTMSLYFRIGTIRIKDSTGVTQIRNAADTAFGVLGAYSARIHGTNSANAVVLQAPAAMGSDVTYTLPGTDGSTGQFLSTNGSGTLAWAAGAANADLVQVESFTEASGTLSIFTPPANGRITRTQVQVEVAAGGGSPTIKIGISGTLDRDMLTTESDLLTVGLYEANPNSDVTGSPVAIVATIVASSQTFSGKVYVYYSNPS